jgi:superfamily II RNA helicase
MSQAALEAPLAALDPSNQTWAGTAGDDEIFEVFNHWVESNDLVLYPAQEEAILALYSDQHAVLTTPTGSGKSMVAYAAHARALGSGTRSFYTAPIKSLVSEKFFDMRSTFGAEAVGMLTGDASINPDAPIICCTAEILAYQALAEGDGSGIELVTMDEFHFYAERDRGWAWQVPLLEMPSTQFLLMSATLGDTRWLVDYLVERSTREVAVIGGGARPVPLDFGYRTTPLTESVAELIELDRAPVYVVHFTQKAATEQAQAFTSIELLSKDEKARLQETISKVRFDTPFGKDLRRFLSHGVGVHHAGLLPRYRLLVEKLAREGLLKLICGTDTLGVGVNVPIRTVLLTQLCKYDGTKTRVLSVREFQQIAGRAGRRGFDSSGTVWAQAPIHVIENLRADAKAAADPSRRRKIVKKKPPERGYAHWDEQTFERLVSGIPETLVSHMQLNHAMVLHLLGRPGDGERNIDEFIERTHESPERKQALSERAASILSSLEASGIIQRVEPTGRNEGRTLAVAGDLQSDFALHHPLSPFLVEVVATMEPEEPAYALDVLSVVESTLDDPTAILLAQQAKARDALYQQLRAEGVEYETRQDLLAEVRWPQPLGEELRAMLSRFAEDHPWVAGEGVRPKAVARGVYEQGSNFKSFVNAMGIKRSEGLLLRYLTEAYKAIDQNVPEAAKTDDLDEIAAWLAAIVRAVDGSLLDEWERLSDDASGAFTEVRSHELDLELAGSHFDVTSDQRAFRAMVRSELFRWVQLLARRAWDELAGLEWDEAEDLDAAEWDRLMSEYWPEFESIAIDAAARGPQNFRYANDGHEATAEQVLIGADGEGSWSLRADVDLEASREAGAPILRVLALGPIAQG